LGYRAGNAERQRRYRERAKDRKEVSNVTHNVTHNVTDKKRRVAEVPVVAAVEIAITIPIVGGEEYPISSKLAGEWERLYPAVDVPQTLREIRAWNLANAGKRKTAGGVVRHVNAWLAREQNRG
jgi:hypothetical protein